MKLVTIVFANMAVPMEMKVWMEMSMKIMNMTNITYNMKMMVETGRKLMMTSTFTMVLPSHELLMTHSII